MYRLLILLLMLTLLPFSGTAEAPLTFSDDLTGVYTWPEGAAEAEADYVYRYCYPRVAGENNVALTINNIFEYEVSDALGFECPVIGSSQEGTDTPMQVELDYEVMHLSDEYLSVCITKTVRQGESESRIVRAFTFTLTGEAAGTLTSLPYLVDALEHGETDEWLIDRQIAKVDACVRDLVWAQIGEAQKADRLEIYDDLTFEEFEWGFYPEEDFYLDAEGNFVFFVQEGVIGPADGNPFFFPLTREELLDEI